MKPALVTNKKASIFGKGLISKPNKGGAGFDPDYQAVLNFADTQGFYLPSAAQQTLQNQLVLDLKANGVWVKLDRFALYANDAGIDFSRIDWKQLNLQTLENAPTFTVNQGFTGNGTNTGIATGAPLNIGGNFTNTVGSYGAWATNGLTTGAHPIAGGSAVINTLRGGNFDTISGSTVGSGITTARMYHLNNNLVQAVQYQNGVSVITNTSGSTADANDFYGLRDSISSSVDTIGMLFSGGDLSVEALSFYNSMNTYFTSL